MTKEFNNIIYEITDDLEEINNIQKGDLVFFNKDYRPMFHSPISKANHLYKVQFVYPDSIAFEGEEFVLDFLYRRKEMYKVLKEIGPVPRWKRIVNKLRDKN